MDDEIKKEFEGINRKLNNIENAIENSTRENVLFTVAVVGFSIVMIGISVWFEQGMWDFTGNFLIIYGIVIIIMMYLKQTKFTTKNAGRWLVILAIIALAISQFINYITTHGSPI